MKKLSYNDGWIDAFNGFWSQWLKHSNRHTVVSYFGGGLAGFGATAGWHSVWLASMGLVGAALWVWSALEFGKSSKRIRDTWYLGLAIESGIRALCQDSYRVAARGRATDDAIELVRRCRDLSTEPLHRFMWERMLADIESKLDPEPVEPAQDPKLLN